VVQVDASIGDKHMVLEVATSTGASVEGKLARSSPRTAEKDKIWKISQKSSKWQSSHRLKAANAGRLAQATAVLQMFCHIGRRALATMLQMWPSLLPEQ